jgi:hypothetical protein
MHLVRGGAQSLQIDQSIWGRSYSRLMGESSAYISIELDLAEPVEIGDFAALFAGLGGQFDDYLRENHPNVAGTARMYVREVRKGSIIADLFAEVDLIDLMDRGLIIISFAALFSSRVRAWISGTPVDGMNRSGLKDANQTIRAIAHDSGGRARLKSYRYVQGVWRSEIEVEFTSNEAREAQSTIERQQQALTETGTADFERVLMTFRRSDIGDADVGARSGERVIVEDVSPRHLPLIYGSTLAEERIKDQMRNTDENIYRKGFVVDLNVQTKGGRPAAYRVKRVHQIIDLDD